MFKAEPPKVEVPIKGLWDHIRAKGLCSTPLENAGRSGVYESGTMKPLFFCASCFSPNYLHSTIQLISPSTTPAPFTHFPFRPVLLFQCAIPLRPFSIHSCLHFPTFLNITISFCAWSKSPPPLSPVLSYPVSSAPTWKAPFFWCSWGSSSYSWVGVGEHV